LRNESFFSAPQLKRDSLGSHAHSTRCVIPDLFYVPFIMMAAGAVSALRAGLRIPRALASVRWPTTEGRVVARDLDDSPGRYEPVFEYRYQVSGAELRGDRISFAPAFDPRSSERALLMYHQYPPGKAVTVYYDPRRPHRSVLEPGLNWPLATQLLGGIGLVVLALVIR